ncbi:MAG: methyltransferase domain-containing protein [Candidatus Sulfotelmatobacter sp.]
MEPHAFIAEVYRRMAARHAREAPRPAWAEMQNDRTVLEAAHQYRPYLPANQDARILDIGFGSGWFLAACLRLGYRKLSGADFGIANKAHVADWMPGCVTLHEIRHNIADFLSGQTEQYDLIHMSHVIEHVPKYSLLCVGDALFLALKKGGTLLLRTPNMEGPCANSSFYVTLSHEYGFAGSNLVSLLDLCGFDEINLVTFDTYDPTWKQRVGKLLRWPFLIESKLRHRLFGANRGGHFREELIVTARRGDQLPSSGQ